MTGHPQTCIFDYLLSALNAGMVVPDPFDPTLKTLRVTARERPR